MTPEWNNSLAQGRAAKTRVDVSAIQAAKNLQRWQPTLSNNAHLFQRDTLEPIDCTFANKRWS